MTRRVVTVFGGSGFIGRQVVRRFAANGWTVRVAVRDPEAAAQLRPMGDPGQVNPLRAEITDPDSVRRAVDGAQAVVNLVGILFERGRASFEAIHHQGAANVATAAREAGAERLVQMSALGADRNSASAYARSKAAGEEAAQAAFPGATVIRPSVVFGPDDDFFNRFARLAVLSPVLPVFTGDGFKPVRSESGWGIDLYGSGGATFQPVYVGDVAEAILRAVENPRLGGRVYELGGPRRYTLKEVLELVMRETGRSRLLVPLPFWVARIQAALLQMLPTPPLTPDQVKLLKVDNVVRGGKPGLVELGIQATAAEAVTPAYLARYRPHS
ncbi:complex I NDUFA9 subunit family protein [Magnetospirillum sp. UT-4]|uniref:complex I NDUFA9 subunit family protein n=1 Tax=Magnetospirillum sp. UT-4 TaxID=2681467 RepID=UPI001382B431|nr:complex I NDUFA9 subunit family protein [Magnetospirillum sp. UT-4]CAA7624661.1 putative NADH-ubiquinone oxidoreductase 40 kDa subunit [Magnetospirillum sp. UT-4]